MPTKPVPSAAQDRIQSVKTPFQESPVLEPEPGLHCSQSLQASPPALNAPPARHGHRDASGCGTEGVVHGRAPGQSANGPAAQAGPDDQSIRATRLSIDDARAPPSDPQARIQSAPLQPATVDLVEPIRRASDGSTLLFSLAEMGRLRANLHCLFVRFAQYRLRLSLRAAQNGLGALKQ